jgi:putative transposase
MSNHLHLVAVPEKEDSLSILLRRVHGRYTQYYYARTGRSGHLWQNRFFACMLGATHVWAALCYVERNPVRAGIVQRAAEYPWSSALAHQCDLDSRGLLDMEWWKRERPKDWKELVDREEVPADVALRGCTYAGKPFGNQAFVSEIAERFGRYWNRGRPKKQGRQTGKEANRASEDSTDQFPLFLKK